MQRYRSKVALLALVASTAGCAFDDGQPWGVASFDVTAAFAPPASRLDGEALKTAKSYRVEFEELEATFDAVELEISSGGEVAGFDPANPPEGYSLCHNGHCHADSGELVPYEEISAEQSGGDFVVTQALEGTFELGAQSRPISEADCSNDCELTRGGLGLVRLSLTELAMTATVRDAAGEADPIEIDLVLPLNARVVQAIDGAVGPGEPGTVNLDIQFELPPSFLDGVAFDELVVTDGVASEPVVTQVRDAIQQDGLLDVEVERAEL